MRHSRVVMRAALFSLLLAASAALAPGPAAADPYRGIASEPAGPPAGRVGRVASVVGAVSIRFPGESRWSEAQRNDPVTAGSVLLTSGGDSHARVELGGDRIALAADTQIEVAGLDDRALDVRLSHGGIAFAVSRFGPGRSVEIELATGEAWLAGPGEYAIAADSDGQTPQIAAFAGSARIYAGGVALGIAAGETVRLEAMDPLVAAIGPAAEDDFVRRFREADRPRLAALHDLSPDLTGAAALDRAGSWRSDGRYGWAWLPDSLPPDWAPYRDGHWRWVKPWGWTWIDDHDWGFATSHYGRWARIDRSWAWVPGKFVAEPMFAPALVAFLGTPGVGVSYEGGSGPAIGWFPLAPGEAYWPAYSDDLDYIRKLNRGALADPAALGPQPDGSLPVQVVGRSFANRLAASVVPRPVFVGGESVRPALLQLPRQRLAEMPLVMGSPRIGAPKPRPVPIAAVGPPPEAKSSAKATAWAKAVAVAAIRSQRYQNMARAAHRRTAAAAAPRPSRQPVAKTAHAQPAKPSTSAHKKVVER